MKQAFINVIKCRNFQSLIYVDILVRDQKKENNANKNTKKVVNIIVIL